MRLAHLNLTVADIERSRAFYERWFGFAEGEPVWHGEALFLRDATNVDLALSQGALDPTVVDAFHFGFQVDDGDEVRAAHARMRAGGVAMEEDLYEEAGYVSFKVADPDGYLVEVYWEDHTTAVA